MSLKAIPITKTSEATRSIRALLLEDVSLDSDLILYELKSKGFSVESKVVRNRTEFLESLRENEFDVILSDYRLPDWTGMDALEAVRESGRDIPFLLITGTLGEEAAVECIKQGVSDYILKNHLERLPLAVKRSLHEKRLREDNASAMTALAESEARARDLVENSVYGICRLNEEGEFLDANPAMLRILSCTSMPKLRMHNLFRDVFRFPEQHVKLFHECRQEGLVRGSEAEWRRLDGGFVSVRLHLRSLKRKNGTPEFELVAEDITELRGMERQLLQAQKFEAIGQLAGGIAHDFNNVVGAILGWAEIGLDQSNASPEIADRFARIREQGERAARLTKELLAFARRQVLQPRLIDLNNIATGLVNFLDRVIGKDVELKIVTAPLSPVKADPTQIEQVLMNLCINARDAMPSGGRLLIETEMADLDDAYCHFYPQVVPGKYVVFSVSDTGMGMDAETKERIFEPFFTTKEPGKGTGMGLASVYGIVKQHGGFIHVYSEVGQGSLFRVYLPCMVSAEALAPQVPSPVVAGQEPRGTELILIAEDHESIREMARQTLQHLGYGVLSAENGEEALQLLEQGNPALAVLDIVMPKLGGQATALQLLQRFPKLPIIFASGYARDTQSFPASTNLMTYLQKPYSPTALGKLVRSLLDQQAKAAGT